MQGRFHKYEGYSTSKVALPARLMYLLGVEIMIVTNAAGGINSDYDPGNIMIIKDHINFPGMAGGSVLRGPNDERFGPRFPTMNNVYNDKLRELVKVAAKNCGISNIREGVYCFLGGPSFETVAELRFLKAAGVDAVGMSTVPEVVAAGHCGLKVCGLSLISNKAIMDYDTDDKPNHEEVLDTGKTSCANIQSLVSDLLRLIEV
ncbi:Purine nucleoside phosphorylase [Trichoplax sp. H2]|nr:Purine nucleoside phosphorylase [Trichoplax sp. H2]|eukprot:RDD40099.1 Purine nucleoside phosphorylase [Trichoplax sp. H2]